VPDFETNQQLVLKRPRPSLWRAVSNPSPRLRSVRENSRELEYIRETVNDNPKVLRVHGVNLSVGYEFDAEMFA
jgi:hypothetical protein